MFDALEARVNRAAMAKLANALALIPGLADPAPVIFDAEYRAGMVGVVGMGASAPQLVIGSDKVPADPVGVAVTVNGSAWRIAEVQPDNDLPTGLSLLILEKA